MSASKARAFLESVAGYADAPVDEVPSQDRPVKLGTIDALYAGSGNPRVLFDGETLMGVKTYPMLQPVKALDRVALIPQGHGYIIAGAIGGGAIGDLVERVDELEGDLVDGLAGKANTSHTHTAAQVTNFNASVDSRITAHKGVPVAVAAGRVTGSSGAYTTVTFPSGRFSSAPSVVATPYANGNVAVVHINALSASSFSFMLFTVGGAQYGGTMSWQAVQW